MATDLYRRMLAINYEDAKRADLMREVWSGHPWMIDAYTGSYDSDRRRAVMGWCFDTFGDQASPIHARPGAWYQGSATINGWTWMGFTNEADMIRFTVRWPAPEGAPQH
ncbi:hypothetical protein ACVWXO_008095 [Bradyrhizobium sp. LM2.7]